MNSTNDFHVYELEWNPGELIWKVDGKQVFNIVYNAKLNDDVPYWEAHPFDQEFYLNFKFSHRWRLGRSQGSR
ncbi:MAG: family 16 glycosylhydrolase [Acholeplasmataceae bacterium]